MRVLLLHAGIADRRMWTPQLEALRAAGHDAFAPDLPGFGDEPLVPPTVDYVAFAAEALGEPGAVVGCSYGGRIALELAGARPELVERLVLVANNDYALDLLSLGERERLDEGLLHLYIPHGFRRITWDERTCTHLEIGSPLPRARTAIDGEPVELDTPLELRIEPLALRVLLPREATVSE